MAENLRRGGCKGRMLKRVRLAPLALSLFLVSCAASDSMVCPDGLRCAPGYACVPQLSRCELEARVRSCRDRSDGEPCGQGGSESGECHKGLCVERDCGDGFVTHDEPCDPEVPETRGECTDLCELLTCGNGVVDVDMGEECDCAVAPRPDQPYCLAVSGTGYCDSRTCEVPAPKVAACIDRVDGRECEYPGVVTGVCRNGECVDVSCGNGITDTEVGEQCDEGSNNSDDGGTCSNLCTLHCGNGTKDTFEQCDGAPPPEEFCTDYGFDFGTLGCLESCDAVDTRFCGKFGFQGVRTSENPPSSTVALWGSAPDDVFAIDNGGARIQHYDGQTWTPMNTPSSTGLRALWGSGPRNVFAAGDSGTILHFDGQAWTQMPEVPTGASVRALWGPTPDEAFAACDDGSILQLRDGRWTVSRVAAAGTQLNGLWGASPRDVFAVGRQEGTDGTPGFVLHFDGLGWEESEAEIEEGLLAVWGTSPVSVFAAGDSGDIFFHEGTSWIPMLPHQGKPVVQSLWGSGPNSIFGVGPQGTVLYFNGEQWRPWPTLGTTNLRAIWGSGPEHILIAGDDGLAASNDDTSVRDDELFRMDTSFQPILSNVRPPLHAMWGSGPRNMVFGSSGILTRFDGEQFTAERSAGFVQAQSVWSEGPSHVFAATQSSVWSFDGSQWREQPVEANRLTSLWGSGPDNVFAAGEGGQVCRSANRWSCETLPGSPDLAALWGSGPDDIYAAGVDSTLHHFDGSTWDRIRPDAKVWTNFSALAGTTRGDVFAAGNNGWVVRRERGASAFESERVTRSELRAVWAHAAHDAFVAGPQSVLWHFNGDGWNPVGMDLQDYGTSFTAVWAPDPTTTYFAAESGLLYRLIRGEEWHRAHPRRCEESKWTSEPGATTLPWRSSQVSFDPDVELTLRLSVRAATLPSNSALSVFLDSAASSPVEEGSILTVHGGDAAQFGQVAFFGQPLQQDYETAWLRDGFTVTLRLRQDRWSYRVNGLRSNGRAVWDSGVWPQDQGPGALAQGQARFRVELEGNAEVGAVEIGRLSIQHTRCP